MMRIDMKRVSGPEDVPDGEHYAVIVYSRESVFVPGDERSRTNPGHGYPERTESYDTFQHYVTTDKEVWTNYIQSLENQKESYYRSKDKYVALHVAGKAKVDTEVRVRIT